MNSKLQETYLHNENVAVLRCRIVDYTKSPLPLSVEDNELINNYDDAAVCELANRINDVGFRGTVHAVLDPDENIFDIVKGRLAFLAAVKAGLKEVPVTILPYDIRLSKTRPELRAITLLQIEADDISYRLDSSRFGRSYDKTQIIAMVRRLKAIEVEIGKRKRALNLKSNKTVSTEQFPEVINSDAKVARISGMSIQDVKSLGYVDKHGSDEIKGHVSSGAISPQKARKQIRESKKVDETEEDFGPIDVKGLHKHCLAIPDLLQTITKKRFLELIQPDQEQVVADLKILYAAKPAAKMAIAEFLLKAKGANNG